MHRRQGRVRDQPAAPGPVRGGVRGRLRRAGQLGAAVLPGPAQPERRGRGQGGPERAGHRHRRDHASRCHHHGPGDQRGRAARQQDLRAGRASGRRLSGRRVRVPLRPPGPDRPRGPLPRQPPARGPLRRPLHRLPRNRLRRPMVRRAAGRADRGHRGCRPGRDRGRHQRGPGSGWRDQRHGAHQPGQAGGRRLRDRHQPAHRPGALRRRADPGFRLPDRRAAGGALPRRVLRLRGRTGRPDPVVPPSRHPACGHRRAGHGRAHHPLGGRGPGPGRRYRRASHRQGHGPAVAEHVRGRGDPVGNLLRLRHHREGRPLPGGRAEHWHLPAADQRLRQHDRPGQCSAGQENPDQGAADGARRQRRTAGRRDNLGPYHLAGRGRAVQRLRGERPGARRRPGGIRHHRERRPLRAARP